MKRFLVLLFFIAATAYAQTGGSSNAVIWSGSEGKVLPSSGLSLINPQGFRLYEDPVNGTNFMTVVGPDFMSGNRTWTIPFLANSNFVGDVATQALTNKTIDCSLNTCSNFPGSSITGQVPIANGGTGQATALAGFNALSPLTTAGDLLYGGASGSGTRLAAGTATQVLIGGTTPAWAAVTLSTMVTGVLPLANGGTNKNMTAVNGGIVWTDGDSGEVSAAGTSGQILHSAGAAAPTWAAVDLATAQVTGVLPLANGGTNKNITASNGAIPYIDADSFETLAPGTTGQLFRSGGAGAPTWAALGRGLLSSDASHVVTASNIYTVGADVGSTCTTGTCSINANYGGGISSITFNSTGNYTVNFTGSFWSAGPVCVSTTALGGDQFCNMNSNASTSSTSLTCFNSAGSLQNGRPSVICTGPR